jgi:AcrR family transcriptional regulator
VAARRPPNRKAQIRSAAAELFRDRGFHNVTMAEVAEAVEITAPALYRHYRNKQDLLLDTVLAGLDAVATATGEATDLDGLASGLTTLALERRGIGALWLRESRHLDPEQREVIRARAAEVLASVVPLVRAERPALSETDAQLTALAVVGLFSGGSGARLALPRRRYEQLFHRLAAGVAHAELPTLPATEPEATVDAGQSRAGVRVPRRDQLLTAAIQLFDERGFQSVGLGDVAEAAGIVRTGVYRYFTNKTELLVAAATVAGERMRQSTAEALARASEPQEALELLLRAYIAVTAEHARLAGILANERDQLPDRERKQYQRFQDDSLDIWLQAVDNALPGRDAAEAKVVVLALQSMVYFVIRSEPWSHAPAREARLTEFGLGLLRAW